MNNISYEYIFISKSLLSQETTLIHSTCVAILQECGLSICHHFRPRSFFIIPSKEEWIVIFNTNWDQHGKDEYDTKDDVLRLKVKPIISETVTEHLEYKVKKVNNNEGSISLAWEKVSISFNFTIQK
jgi:hypothetical protein